jgi:hypothetical protein
VLVSTLVGEVLLCGMDDVCLGLSPKAEFEDPADLPGGLPRLGHAAQMRSHPSGLIMEGEALRATETNMSAAKVSPTKAVRPLTDDAIVEGRSVRGLLFGLLMAGLFWLLMAGLALTLF